GFDKIVGNDFGQPQAGPERSEGRVSGMRRAYPSRVSRIREAHVNLDYRRGAREAEGAPLLREYRVKSSIEGSNPSLSARNANAPAGGICISMYSRRARLRTSRAYPSLSRTCASPLRFADASCGAVTMR